MRVVVAFSGREAAALRGQGGAPRWGLAVLRGQRWEDPSGRPGRSVSGAGEGDRVRSFLRVEVAGGGRGSVIVRRKNREGRPGEGIRCL